MPGPTKGYTTPHRCMTVNSSRRNQPSDRDRQARQKLQEKTSDFQVHFHNCVYLSIGLEAKRDIYNTFDPDKPFNIHLDSPSTEQPPLVEIKQEGRLLYTPLTFISQTSYHLISRYHPQVKIILCPLEIRQQQQIPLYLTQILYSQDIEDIDIEATFHALNLCPQEDEEEKSNGRKDKTQEDPAN